MKITPAPILPRLSDSEYQALRASIEEFGVLTPLLIDHRGTIIDGHERWRVIVELGIKSYPLRVFGRMSEDQRVEYAIKCNALRRHLTRAERQRLLLAYIQAAPTKSARAIADACKVSPATAARAKQRASVASETVGLDGRIYKPRPAATSVEGLHHARLVGKLLNDLQNDEVQGGISPRKLKKAVFDSKVTAMSEGVAITLPTDYKLIFGDFRTATKRIADSSVDFGFSDPPWAETYNHLLSPLMATYERILKPGSLLALYTGVLQIPAMLEAAQTAGLEYWWQVVCLNPSSGSTTRQGGSVKATYRPVLIFVKPGNKSSPSKQWLTDTIQAEVEPVTYHEWQQPLGEAIEILRGLAQPGWLCGDICAGSGTTAVACLDRGLRWVGCEIDPKTHRIASHRIADALIARGKTVPLMAKVSV